jgi:hypothetical protein
MGALKLFCGKAKRLGVKQLNIYYNVILSQNVLLICCVMQEASFGMLVPCIFVFSW